MKLKVRRRHVWTLAVVVVAVVFVVLLALIALGVLVVPGSHTPASVHVREVSFYIFQGTNGSGRGWFGPDYVNITGIANGYPFSVAPGGSFSVPLLLENYDSAAHTIYSAAASSPFVLDSTSPPLPATALPYQEDVSLEMTFTVPNTPGAVLTLYVTVNAQVPS